MGIFSLQESSWRRFLHFLVLVVRSCFGASIAFEWVFIKAHGLVWHEAHGLVWHVAHM